MTAATSPSVRIKKNLPDRPDSTGLCSDVEEHRDPAAADQPVAMAWMTDELIADTQRVWARQLRRDIPRDEAIEMLMNVKRIAEAFHLAAQTGDSP